MTQGTFAALHSKCMNSAACEGPGCRVTANRYSSAAPRLRDRPTKAERQLAVRQSAYASHGRNPLPGGSAGNPSNSSGQGHDMHKPGSLNWRK